MDRFEHKLTLSEIEELYNKGEFQEASELCDKINWKKIKNVASLTLAAEVYNQMHRYDQCKEVMLLAYEKSVQGKSKKIMFRLCMIAIEAGQISDAQQYYNEYAALAPHDSGRYELLFYMSRKKKDPISAQIKILEALKEHDFSPEWMYKLAYLYHEAGMVHECVDACNEMVLYFQDGDFVIEALRLKKQYEPLSLEQDIVLQDLLKRRQGIVEVRPGERYESGEIVTSVKDIPEVKYDPTKYNTVNLQAELARGMQQIRSASSKEQVEDAMNTIRHTVEGNPYVAGKITDQLPSAADYDRQYASDREIEGELNSVYNEILAQETPVQPTGDMSEIMGDWGRTQRAATMAMQEIEARKLETARARALHETNDMLSQLYNVDTQTAQAEAQEIINRAYANPTPENMEAATRAMEQLNQQMEQQIAMMTGMQQQMQSNITQMTAPLPDLSGRTNRNALGNTSQLNVDPYAQPVSQNTAPQRDFRGYSEDYVKNVQETQEIPEPTQEFLEAEPIPEPSQMFDEQPLETEPQGFDEIIGKWSNFREIDAEADERKAQQEEEIIESVGEINIEEEIAAEIEQELESNESVQDEFLPEIDMNIFADDTPGWTEPVRQMTAPLPVVPPEVMESNIETRGFEEEPLPVETKPVEPVVEETPTEITPELDLSDAIIAETASMATGKLPDVTNKRKVTQETVRLEQPKVSQATGQLPGKDMSMTQTIRQSTKPMERLERSNLLAGYHGGHIDRLTPELAAGFSYFAQIEGMKGQICTALNAMSDYVTGAKPIGGNLVISGDAGSGRSRLAENMIRTLQILTGKPGKSIGKTKGDALNNKDIVSLFDKLAGKSLIIEDASKLRPETCTYIVQYMKANPGNVLLILEDERGKLDAMFASNESFMHLFGASISIPVFTDNELVEFAKTYAHEAGYEMDNMAELALHNRINIIQKVEHIATITQVKDIMDQAIDNAERPGLKKFFGIITSKRYTDEENYVIIHEKDFE